MKLMKLAIAGTAASSLLSLSLFAATPAQIENMKLVGERGSTTAAMEGEMGHHHHHHGFHRHGRHHHWSGGAATTEALPAPQMTK